MNTQKKKILAIVSLLLVLVFAGAAVMVSYRINSQQKVAPSAPESIPMAAELSDADIPSEAEEAALDAAGTKKPLCGKCTTTANCKTNLICDPVDSRCKVSATATTCWVGGPACIAKATAACTPTASVTIMRTKI